MEPSVHGDVPDVPAAAPSDNSKPVILRLAPSQEQAGERRFTELDALRGLAACIVVFTHFFLLPKVPSARLMEFLTCSPGVILLCGAQSVALFFVLSGFVLALPYTRGTMDSYPAFVIKRIFRIYVPYLGALGLAILGASQFHNLKGEFSPWFEDQWNWPVDPWLIVQHVLFLGHYKTTAFVLPIWSLVLEMRISLVFPLLCFVVLRLSTAGAVAMGLAFFLVDHIYRHFDPAHGELGLHYLALFVLGIVLARRRREITHWINGRPPTVLIALFAAWCISFELSTWPVFGPTLFGIPAALLIVLALGENFVSRFLRRTTPTFLGRISYSIYLLHVPILLAMVYLFHHVVSLPWLLVPYLLAVLTISSGYYRLVELPSIRAGRYIAGRWFAAPK